MDLFWFLGSTCCSCVFYGNDFVVAVAVVAAVVLYFEYVDFVAFAAGAVHTLLVDCVPTVGKICVAVMIVLLFQAISILRWRSNRLNIFVINIV